MAALAIGVKKIETSVTIPNDNRAKLMYYVDCVCTVLQLDDEDGSINRLRRYNNYYLSDAQEEALLVFCLLFTPDVLEGTCFFLTEEGERLNEFYEISAVTIRFVVTDSVLIGGQQRRVRQIMTFKIGWMEKFWSNPLKVIFPIY